MTTRVMIVGQAPGARNGARRAFEGPCARRLAELVGVTKGELRRRARLTNLLGNWPGNAGWRRGGKGDHFPLDEARAAAARKPLAAGWNLLAGHGVGEAYGIRNSRYFHVHHLGWSEAGEEIRAVVVPHPSGVNRWWNDEANVRVARRFFRRVVR